MVADALSRKAESMGSLAYIPVGERSLALNVQDTVHHGDAKEVTIGDDGALWMQGRICVPNVDELREFNLEEAHSSQYSIHLGAVKMYQDLRLLGTNLVRDALEKVKLIQDRLRTMQSRKKSYTDRRARDVAFMLGEGVLLRVSPMKGVMTFKKKGNLSPSYIGPFDILKIVG
ncbi:uncharacterized protein [Nicotiana tomentosiformis]|uniref:uncharacterized protein n=1 Tax=Nicotiana tomentosiformis TaxID=4098 RepID=UPI00388C36E8